MTAWNHWANDNCPGRMDRDGSLTRDQRSIKTTFTLCSKTLKTGRKEVEKHHHQLSSWSRSKIRHHLQAVLKMMGNKSAKRKLSRQLGVAWTAYSISTNYVLPPKGKKKGRELDTSDSFVRIFRKQLERHVYRCFCFSIKKGEETRSISHAQHLFERKGNDQVRIEKRLFHARQSTRLRRKRSSFAMEIRNHLRSALNPELKSRMFGLSK